ncbi:MAG: phenylacetate--CoA ligase family protein, partial [Sciscionella sp.]
MTIAAPPPLVDPDAEGCDPERRRELQQRRLRRLVDRLVAAGGLQAARLRDVSVRCGDDVSLDDLPKLPTVSKQDLWEHYPHGMRAVPDHQIVCVHGSSGTGGRPTLVPYTAHDLDVWAQVMARALGGAGAGRNSVVHNAYGYGLFTGGLGVHHGAIRLGATVIPVSGGMTERQLRLIVDLRPDILTCTPSYAIHLGEAIRAAGLDASSVTAGVFGAEPWTDAMRVQIEALLGLRALDIYGLAEVIGPGVACESLDSGGLLTIAEDHFYPETLGTDGAPVPDGAPGELVFSTLTKTGMPLLRYRTGDIATLAGPVDRSARTLRRMSK